MKTIGKLIIRPGHEKDVIVCICERCGYEWAPRVETPKQCISCKSTTWNVPFSEMKFEIKKRNKNNQLLSNNY